MNRKRVLTGIILTLILLVIHLAVIDDYGLTWDFHHHFFSGLYMLKHPITPDLLKLPFTEPYPITSVQLPFGPLMTITPVLTYLLFFEKLKLLAFDNAYNLGIILGGVSGVLILFLFILDSLDFGTALTAAVILALYPRFFGDLHNNMKDIPQAAAFALAVWIFWRFANRRKLRDMFLGALAFGIAFNTKVNTVFMPVVAALWMVVLLLTKAAGKLAQPIRGISVKAAVPFLVYAGAAALFSLAIWWPFWDNPLERLLYLPTFFQLNTVNIEVVYYGKWFCSGVNIPWHYPFGYLLAVTPLPVTVFFIIGALMLLVRTFKKEPLPSLLLLWFIVPTLRFFMPKVWVMDGIRHFQEVIYPLAAIAAVGVMGTWRAASRTVLKNLNARGKRILGALLAALALAYLTGINVIYHPYQISYFSEAVGGIRGALGKFDIEYWGTSQKRAVQWLNEHAPKDAVINIVMLPDVSSKYLRPDLLAHVNSKGFDDSDYVVVLNRQSFFYRYFYLWEYFLRRKTAYVVENQGVPLVWIYDNSIPGTPRRNEWWQGEDPCMRKYWTSPPGR